MNAEDHYIEWKKAKEAEDKTCNYTKSWRLLCSGVVIDQVPDRMSLCKSQLYAFKNNIIAAITTPEWMYNGTMPAADWIKYQETRLSFKLSTDLQIVPPGQYHQICLGLETTKLDENLCQARSRLSKTIEDEFGIDVAKNIMKTN